MSPGIAPLQHITAICSKITSQIRYVLAMAFCSPSSTAQQPLLQAEAASVYALCWPLGAPNHRCSVQQCTCKRATSIEHMARLLAFRLPNTPSQELLNAAVEQMKITELRLRSMVASQQPQRDGSATSTAERRAGRILQHVRGG